MILYNFICLLNKNVMLLSTCACKTLIMSLHNLTQLMRRDQLATGSLPHSTHNRGVGSQEWDWPCFIRGVTVLPNFESQNVEYLIQNEIIHYIKIWYWNHHSAIYYTECCVSGWIHTFIGVIMAKNGSHRSFFLFLLWKGYA